MADTIEEANERFEAAFKRNSARFGFAMLGLGLAVLLANPLFGPETPLHPTTSTIEEYEDPIAAPETDYQLESQLEAGTGDLLLSGTHCPAPDWPQTGVAYEVYIGVDLTPTQQVGSARGPLAEPGHLSANLVDAFRQPAAQTTPDQTGSWTAVVPSDALAQGSVISAICLSGAGLQHGTVRYRSVVVDNE